MKITYLEASELQHTLDFEPGLSVMEVAVRNNVPGIDADCGGACACATCHIYIDDAWKDLIDAPNPMEESMLEFAENTTANSRLGCQIRLTENLDGMQVRLPPSQS